ncbi:hypothetical protein CesoFtcFv8_011744 [Champsocephalus esox]|uniref:Uncharacterized protein n=1 Tax=Champsocephalus esox TaxID=159716 RepID=A0AAN8C161_9TELE|nr:hypothetical protein CesoFtcFv8_011744 [Champsocephalus esox]
MKGKTSSGGGLVVLAMLASAERRFLPRATQRLLLAASCSQVGGKLRLLPATSKDMTSVHHTFLLGFVVGRQRRLKGDRLLFQDPNESSNHR